MQKYEMTVSTKYLRRHFIGLFLVLTVGFALSSGIAAEAVHRISESFMPGLQERLYHHIRTLEVDATHYFLLPSGGYSLELFTQPLPPMVLVTILVNALFNILFQPVFFCVFTPQVILNAVLLPFFLYAAARHAKKAWPLLVLFCALAFQVGIYDSGVEALIRHGMLCELIYLLIGSAGFADWISKNSSS